MKPATVRVVVAVLVLALVLGGVGIAVAGLVGGDDRVTGGASDGPTGPPRTAPAPTSTPDASTRTAPRPALADYYSQTLSWTPCRDDFECATLTVPMDYARPGARDLEIALLKDPADDPDARIGSLVVNPGGPGAPGTDFATQSSFFFSDPIREAYDIVGFDPRGTGTSAPVDCLSDGQLDDFVSSDPDPDTPAEVREVTGWADTIGRGCVQRSGALASHVSTVEAARDMDVLRAALDEPELAYFGASYGTKLGATYAELFADRVGRFVLDGAIDPTLDPTQLSLGQATGFETALRAYVADCVAQDSCFLGDSVEAGLDNISDFLISVDEQPLPAGDGRELRVGNAFYGLVLPLYRSSDWPVLSQALQAGLRGDGSVLLYLADIYSSRDQDGSYSDNSAEAIYAINCLDDPRSLSASQVPAEFGAFDEASPTLGRVFAWGLVGCSGTVARASEAPPVIRAEGAAPIVVIGTTRDPATPYVWAQALASQLESGRLITRDGDGHTGYGKDNACVNGAVDGFLLEGTVPEDGLSC